MEQNKRTIAITPATTSILEQQHTTKEWNFEKSTNRCLSFSISFWLVMWIALQAVFPITAALFIDMEKIAMNACIDFARESQCVYLHAEIKRAALPD